MATPRRQGGAPSGKSERAFRTISEVSEEVGVPQHVLRFWETRFAQVKPMKRNGGRRLYRPDHVLLLKGIRSLLYDDGLTIKGVQKILREQGVKAVVARGSGEGAGAAASDAVPEDAPERLAALRSRLEGEGAGRAATGGTVAGESDEAGEEASEAPAEQERERVRASIARLEAILERLEKG
jgi:DNA-binding transcriptional MerR regulator